MSGETRGRLSVASAHTVLYCERWDECVRFYRDQLGFAVSFTNELFVEVQTSRAGYLGLMDASRTRYPPEAPRGFLLSFRVEDVEKVHADLKHRLAGLPPLIDHAWGARLFETRDPDGRRVEFWSPSPKGAAP